ncbi:hypothetical protein M427DRAFT_162982 [Gonapodya prolifera JEL478]|uniref:UBA domain-containing protein n=1 Tax=Gonapodya prolifera (strain JEL478) TaxID=1344416 RepID=A0A139AZR7_GONPJ|nr:hypothetical protein M427DRAFT_162982 [Gonapodya prolifera JEL478]|eukprot:KXS22053.1 hypothetical protein M427DRAFT_162982 [Gonapodya prolifera JEL478]
MNPSSPDLREKGGVVSLAGSSAQAQSVSELLASVRWTMDPTLARELSEYAPQVSTLHRMGFTDDAANIAALRLVYGDVSRGAFK